MVLYARLQFFQALAVLLVVLSRSALCIALHHWRTH
jgi:hypothetical protein